MSNTDDDFGGFEEATTNVPQSSSKLPDWLLSSPSTENRQNKSPTPDLNNNPLNAEFVKHLQEELSRTKEQLLDQQTNYLHLQIQHRQELEESSNSASKTVKEFQVILEKALSQQREIMMAEFRNYQVDQENRILRLLKEINQKYDQQLNERFENKLAEFQGSLIKHCESGFEDMEIKMKHAIDASLKEEFLGDKLMLKQSFERLEKDLKTDMEKFIQNYFRTQSEIYKEQIKSGVMQEHLIHKDMINSKLEKLFKASEDKRRRTQILFARHLSGLNFFVDNAHKQLGILKDAYKDLIKNKDIIDSFGEEASNSYSFDEKLGKEEAASSFNSLSSFSLAALGLGGLHKQGSREKSDSKDNLYADDEGLLDENLLQDV